MKNLLKSTDQLASAIRDVAARAEERNCQDSCIELVNDAVRPEIAWKPTFKQFLYSLRRQSPSGDMS